MLFGVTACESPNNFVSPIALFEPNLVNTKPSPTANEVQPRVFEENMPAILHTFSDETSLQQQELRFSKNTLKWNLNAQPGQWARLDHRCSSLTTLELDFHRSSC